MRRRAAAEAAEEAAFAAEQVADVARFATEEAARKAQHAAAIGKLKVAWLPSLLLLLICQACRDKHSLEDCSAIFVV